MLQKTAIEQARDLLEQKNYLAFERLLAKVDFPVNEEFLFETIKQYKELSNKLAERTHQEINTTILNHAVINNCPEAVIEAILLRQAKVNFPIQIKHYTESIRDSGFDALQSTYEFGQECLNALDYAIRYRNLAVVCLLKAYGAECFNRNTQEQCKSLLEYKSMIQSNNVTRPHRKRLFLGEGDFGYSVSILKKHEQDKPHLGQSFIVTEYMTRSQLAQRFAAIPGGKERLEANLMYLNAKGATIRFDFDATELAKAKFELIPTDDPISRIHFCCPHAGSTHTANLVKDFLMSAAKVQQDGHLIHLALAGENNRAWWQGVVYKIAEAAREAGYICETHQDFANHQYSSYRHSTNQNQLTRASQAIGEYVFKKASKLSKEQIDETNQVISTDIFLKDKDQWIRAEYFNSPVAEEPFSSQYGYSSAESQAQTTSNINVNLMFNGEQAEDEEKSMHQKDQEINRLKQENEQLRQEISQLKQQHEEAFKYINYNFVDKMDPEKKPPGQDMQKNLKRKRENKAGIQPVIASLMEEENYADASKLLSEMAEAENFDAKAIVSVTDKIDGFTNLAKKSKTSLTNSIGLIFNGASSSSSSLNNNGKTLTSPTNRK